MKEGDAIQVAHYLDTEKTFGAVIELGNAGKIRAPWRRYPAA